MLGTILIILVIFPPSGSTCPTWPYSGSWGYYPSGTLGLVLVIVVVLALLGRLVTADVVLTSWMSHATSCSVGSWALVL